jgi:prephenate dehydratase
VKNNSGIFPKTFIMDALENAPGGVHIVLKGTAPNGINLVAIMNRYSSKTTLFFVVTAYAGPTTPRKLYEMIHG